MRENRVERVTLSVEEVETVDESVEDRETNGFGVVGVLAEEDMLIGRRLIFARLRGIRMEMLSLVDLLD